VGVIVLSITLGAWPLADPHWKGKVAYCVIISLASLSALYFSGREKGRLERRHRRFAGALIMDLKSKAYAVEQRLTRIVQEQRKATEAGSTPPSVNDRYNDCIAEVTGVLSQFVHLSIFLTSELRAALDKEPKTIHDVVFIIKEMLRMNDELSELYRSTALGD
jgi:hypothetical protein